MTHNVPKPILAIYGAIDRFNYGDLLFPFILESLIESAFPGRYRIECVGLQRKNLEKVGGRSTRSLRWLLRPGRLTEDSVIIVAGGEVLGADWARLSSYLLPPSMGDGVYHLLERTLGEPVLNRLARIGFGAPWRVPFVIDPTTVPGTSCVLYNGVGGTSLLQKPDAWNAEVGTLLAGSGYCSVRDRVTRDLLGENGADVDLAPDCAVLVSDLFPVPELRTRLSASVARLIDDLSGGYLCFQCNRYFGPGALKKIARQLDAIAAETGLKVVLLPLAHIPGHSDRVALEILQSLMKSDAVMPERPNLFDLAALIANSRFFIGTSLHGVITAMSYEVPHIGLAKAAKLAAFVGTWGQAPFDDVVDPAGIHEAVLERLDHPEPVLAAIAGNVKTEARRAFEKMARAFPT